MVSLAVTTVATWLSILHVDHTLMTPIALTVCAAVLGLAAHHAQECYSTIRRHPVSIVPVGVLLCLLAILAGSDNQELVYVDIMILSALSIVVPLRLTAVAAALAGIGLATPNLDSPTLVGLVGIAMVAPAFFWLLVEYLARFMLQLNRLIVSARASSSSETGLAPSDRTDEALRTTLKRIPERAESRSVWPHAQTRWQKSLGQERSVLTARQQQSVFLMCAGFDDQEIAEIMGVSISIVRRHLAEARRRTGSATRGQLAAWVVSRGLA